jgi:hypothetical protein
MSYTTHVRRPSEESLNTRPASSTIQLPSASLLCLATSSSVMPLRPALKTGSGLSNSDSALSPATGTPPAKYTAPLAGALKPAAAASASTVLEALMGTVFSTALAPPLRRTTHSNVAMGP